MTTLMEWDAERAAILKQEPAASFDAAGQAYADDLLRACQDSIFRPFHARAMLACLPSYDYWLVMDLADAIKAAPIPDPERRGEIHGALQMAHAIIWAEAHAEEGWSSLPKPVPGPSQP